MTTCRLTWTELGHEINQTMIEAQQARTRFDLRQKGLEPFLGVRMESAEGCPESFEPSW